MAPRLSFEKGPAVEDRASFTLPPLILHPFADAAGPNKLVESSRASLKLQDGAMAYIQCLQTNRIKLSGSCRDMMASNGV